MKTRVYRTYVLTNIKSDARGTYPDIISTDLKYLQSIKKTDDVILTLESVQELPDNYEEQK